MTGWRGGPAALRQFAIKPGSCKYPYGVPRPGSGGGAEDLPHDAARGLGPRPDREDVADRYRRLSREFDAVLLQLRDSRLQVLHLHRRVVEAPLGVSQPAAAFGRVHQLHQLDPRRVAVPGQESGAVGRGRWLQLELQAQHLAGEALGGLHVAHDDSHVVDASPHARQRTRVATGVASSEYRPGKREDFDRLYRQTYDRIFRTLISVTGDRAAAEDCTQDAFLQAFKAWSRWKQDAPAEAWIHRIAINTAISYRRKQRLREVGELIRRLGHPSVPDPTAHDLRADLLREMRRLPAKQAAALVLRHLHGYTNREIAAALGAPESTIASRLLEAKRTLRIRLGGRRQEIFDTSEGRRVPYSE